MTTTRLAPVLCPYCGHTLDAATEAGGSAVPVGGDFTVCIRCAGLLVFDAALRPTKPALGEYEAACREQPDLAASITRLRREILLSAVSQPWPDEKRQKRH